MPWIELGERFGEGTAQNGRVEHRHPRARPGFRGPGLWCRRHGNRTAGGTWFVAQLPLPGYSLKHLHLRLAVVDRASSNAAARPHELSRGRKEGYDGGGENEISHAIGLDIELVLKQAFGS